MDARVDLWLSVVPDPTAYSELAHVPEQRVKALMDMLEKDVLLTPDLAGDRRSGWERNSILVQNGEASAQLVYQLVDTKLALYAADRAKDARTAPDDWSRKGIKLLIDSKTGKGEKLGQYYYDDKVTRWCRYRLALVRDSDLTPWRLTRTVDGKTLSATVEASLSVQMV